jgi:ketosteroid isomerase-like protein
MRSGAATPEELESLLEDGFVLGDRHALAELFDADAVLCAGPGPAAVEARGSEQIARAAGALCERGYRYLADPQRVLQAGDTALVVASRAVNVMRRGADRRWRYAVAYLPAGGAAEGRSR